MRTKLIRRPPTTRENFMREDSQGALIGRPNRIRSLGKGRFTLWGKPAKSYSMDTHYAKVTTNQQEAEKYDKNYRYYSEKTRETKRPRARVVIKTHNKEYTEKIRKQETLRKQNDAQRTNIQKFIFGLMKKNQQLTQQQKQQLEQMIIELFETATELAEGENLFLKRNPKSPARKLAIKRIQFAKNNIWDVKEAFEKLYLLGLIDGERKSTKGMDYKEYLRATDKMNKMFWDMLTEFEIKKGIRNGIQNQSEGSWLLWAKF